MVSLMRLTVGMAASLLILAGCGGEPASRPAPSIRSVAGSPTPDEVSASPSAASPQPSATATPRSDVSGEPKVSVAASGLEVPWAVLPLRDNSLLVSERNSGAIVRIADSGQRVLRTLPVAAGGEGGLLGLAITADSRTVFAYYTTATDNRIVSMPWDGKGLGEPKVVLEGIPHANVHNGGGLLIGPDELLYVGTGDARQADSAQDPNSLGGKILRLRLDGQPAPGNPFDTAVYSLGHRNVQGLAFRGGHLWASEFGASTWDELNLIIAGGNYGWPEVEGRGGVEGMIDPKLIWATSEASPSGLASWRGSLWMGALRGKRLWQIPVRGEIVGSPIAHITEKYGRLRAVAVARNGDALLVTTSNRDVRGKPADDDDRILSLEWR